MESEERLHSEAEELSDDQIEHLLNQAEVRLRTQLASQPSRALTARHTKALLEAPVQSKNSIAQVEGATLVGKHDRKLADTGVKKVEDPLAVRRHNAEAKKATAGPNWFHMPRTDLTPQLKRDLQVLRMRNVLDPKRHYKKDSSRPAVPEFSQVGTLIEGPTDFYSARLTKKERKKTLMEGILESERENGRFKQKYEELQVKKKSGKKGYYKDLLKKRYGKKALKR